MKQENTTNKDVIQHRLEMISERIKSNSNTFSQTHEDKQLSELTGPQFNWADKQLYKLCTQKWGVPMFLPSGAWSSSRFVWNHSDWIEKKLSDAELSVKPYITLNNSEPPGVSRWSAQGKIWNNGLIDAPGTYEMKYLSWCSAWECSKFLDIKLDPNDNDSQHKVQKQLNEPPDYFHEIDRELFDTCCRILGAPKVIVKDCGTKLAEDKKTIELTFCKHLEWGGGGFKPNVPPRGSFGITVPLERPTHVVRHVELDGTSHLIEKSNDRDIWSVIITNGYDCQEQRIEKTADRVIKFLRDCGVLQVQYVQKNK